MKNRILTILVSLVILSLVNPFSQNFNNDSTNKIRMINKIGAKTKTSYISEIENINNEINIIIKEANERIDEIKIIKDKKEWFISYKEIIKEYSYILDPPETIYDYYTNEDLDLLFRVVQAEVGDEYSFDQKANVVSVIFNRIEHESFDDEMMKILTKDQFQPIDDERYKEVEVSEDTILACEYVYMFGDTTDGCLFFDSNGKLDYEFVMNDGAHNLYK